MTKTIEEKQKFIQLRAQGLSFDKIAEELNISKPTLIKFQAELNEEVKAQQYFELENLLEKYSVMRRDRFEVQTKLLEAVFQELEKKVEEQKLSELSVSELLKLAFQVEKRLAQDTEKPLLKVNLPDNWNFQLEEVVEL